MEKHLRFLPICLFVSYIIKVLLFNPSISDAFIIFAVGALVVAAEYRLQATQYQVLEKKLADIVAEQAKNTTDISAIRDGLSSVRMLTGIKTQNLRG